ncbi:MAG TPA: IS66 family transposase [Gemmatimonadaceae bacterium]|jgi:transposase|nr:IS66 family transposase [Gemmatimonadaceae bacterium]
MATDTPEIRDSRAEAEPIAVLTARVRELEAELVATRTRLVTENQWLALKIQHLNQQLWGRKSERLPRDAAQTLLGLDAAVAPLPPARSHRTTAKTGLPKGPKPLLPALRREVIALPDPDAETRLCPITHQPMIAGWVDTLEVLARTRPEYDVKHYTRTVFVSPTGKVPPVYTAWPTDVLPRSRMHASVIAHLATAHYADHQPYHRLEGQLRRQGLTLRRNSQAALMGHLDTFVAPVIRCIKRAVLASGYVQLDATPIAVLDRTRRGRAREGTLWNFRSLPPPGEPPMVWCTYSETKSPTHPQQVLTEHGYAGIVQTDAAKGLDATLGRPGQMTHTGCWAHARRKFVDAYRVGDAHALPYLDAIARLFQIDARARRFGLTARQQQALRARYSVPIVHALVARAERELATLAPKSDLYKALYYLLAQRAPLARCVTTLGVRLDNNLVENSIRPLKLGEANWLFVGAPTAGPRLANLYTLIENCRMAGVDPEAYLADLITRLLDHPANRLHELLPHAWKATQTAPPETVSLSHAA